MSQVEQNRVVENALSPSHVGRRNKPRKPKPAKVAATLPPAAAQPQIKLQLLCGGIALMAGVWAYWPTLVEIVSAWEREADYSHGYLVVPLALGFLWIRRGAYPGFASPAYILGMGLLATSVLTRYLGARFYYDFIDGYSFLIWLAAMVALLGGRKLLWWTLPSIGFLFFMIPLPFGIEMAMSQPLQRIATKLSCAGLQILGQPAFAEGNVILLGDQQIEVAQACSGLRLFMSVVALAYAFVVVGRLPDLRKERLDFIQFLRGRFSKTVQGGLADDGEPASPQSQRAMWENVILLASIAPIAILANAARIVVTGLLFQFSSGDVAHKFSHDFAGYAMIPLAAAMFGLMLWYMGKLIHEEEVMEMSAMMRETKI